MSNKTLQDFPEVDIRESKYELDYILKRLSAYDTDHMPGLRDPYLEIILRLGNEIIKLKEENEK